MTSALIAQYRMFHEIDAFPGLSVMRYVWPIRNFCRKHEAKSLIDYGCGGGHQYISFNMHLYWEVDVTPYDPATDKWRNPPREPSDVVICIDVLEHLEEQEVPDFIRGLFHLAKKAVFLTVCTRKANKTLPDGRNCHLTIRPVEWWIEQIENVADKPYEIEVTE